MPRKSAQRGAPDTGERSLTSASKSVRHEPIAPKSIVEQDSNTSRVAVHAHADPNFRVVLLRIDDLVTVNATPGRNVVQRAADRSTTTSSSAPEGSVLIRSCVRMTGSGQSSPRASSVSTSPVSVDFRHARRPESVAAASGRRCSCSTTPFGMMRGNVHDVGVAALAVTRGDSRGQFDVARNVGRPSINVSGPS